MEEPVVPGILARIRKLLALAGNNPSRAEAESAMMKAQSMLASHGLAMHDLEPEASPVREQLVSGSTRRTPWWHDQVAMVVAANFRCAVFRRPVGGYRRLVLVGRSGDLEVAEAVLELAIETAGREARRFLAARKRTAPWRSRTVSIALRNDFLHGFLTGLRESFRRNVEATGTALMLVRPVEVVEHLDSLGLRPGRAQEHLAWQCPEARGAGFSVGRRFSHRDRLQD